MSNIVELVALSVAVSALIYFVVEPIFLRRRHRQDQEHLDFLSNTDDPSAPAPTRVRLERHLRAAGLNGPVEAYLLALSALVAAAGYWVLRAMPDVPAAAAVAAGFTAYLPVAVVKELARRRANRIERQLTDAIDLATGTLQSGCNLTQAIATAASGASQPLKGEFETILQRVSLAMPLDRALGSFAERYDSEGVKLFALALTAKSQVGGELAPVLRSLNETLRDRWRQQRQVRAQLAGARMTALVVIVLPYVVAPVLAYLQPGWFQTLADLPLGPSILFFAVMIQLTGALWIWRILAREL